MKCFVIITTLLICLLMLSSCGHTHTWSLADCTNPQTCLDCGEIAGKAFGHNWKDANCDNPKTCTRCGYEEGDALGHVWIEATCSTPKTCSVCEKTDGGSLGHDFKDATCVEPQTCSVCNITLGGLGDHTWIEATTESPKTCSVCGRTEGTALKNYNETTKKVVSGYTDAINYSNDLEYAYNDVRDMLVKLNSAAYINDSEQVKVQYYKLFGDYTGYSIAQLQQQAQYVLSYVVAKDEDKFSALMSKFSTMSSVSGTITNTEVDIVVNDIDAFVVEMGDLRPQILGGILAVLNAYDYSWLDDNEPNFLQFTETGFTFHWKAIGNYSLNLS